MEELEFTRLIEKYQRGELSRKERMLLDEWFDKLGQDKVHRLWTTNEKFALKQKILLKIKAVNENAEGQDSSRQSFGLPTENRQKSAFVFLRNAYRVAAAVLLVAVSSYLIWKYIDAEPASTAVMQMSTVSGKVLLPDGSIVWLKDNSELSYPAKFSANSREVVLKGEGLFEVAKDAQHPFVIRCGELTTTVLGTSFNIKSIDEDVEVVVLTGKVSVKRSGGGDDAALVLLANEKAVYSGSKKQLAKLEAVNNEDRAALLKRTEYEMRFEDARMSEIILRIERKFHIAVTIEDPAIHNCMVTADFTDQSLDRTLNMISQALGLQYKVTDTGRVTLSGSGCQLK